MTKQPVYILSDRSGATAETICQTLLTQFPGVEFDTHAMPFVDSNEKISQAIQTINQTAQKFDVKPMVFTTFVEQNHSDQLALADAVVFDLFEPFISRMEESLHQQSSHKPGQSHGMINPHQYSERIGAVNYAMHCDDGLHTNDYEKARVILTGVSRSGKTPTSLYLALHFGIFVANYPLTEEDFEYDRLPQNLAKYKNKIYGLLIEPNRLMQIRQERRPDSVYASLAQCKKEIDLAKALYTRNRIPFCDSTRYSIEELGSTIKHQMRLDSSFY